MSFAFGVFLFVLGFALIVAGIGIAVREWQRRPAGFELDPVLVAALLGGGTLVVLGIACIGYGLNLVGATDSEPVDWWKVGPLSPDTPEPEIPPPRTVTLPQP